MGQKRTFPQTTNGSGILLLNAAAMSGTSTILSAVQSIQYYDNIGLEISWTGTPTGTISILASISDVNFYPYAPALTLTQPAGSAGGYLLNLNQVPYPYIKVQYVNSSGTGALSVWVSAKDLN